MWIEFAGLVRDAKVVYEFMRTKGIGLTEPNYYVSYALYFEKYERNGICRQLKSKVVMKFKSFKEI